MVKRLLGPGEHMLNPDEVGALLKVIQAMFKETLEAVIKLVQDELKRLQDKGERLAKALLSILLDSLEWARDRIKDPKNQPWVDIAGADLGGALTGAIGGIPGGLPGVLSGALFGAIAGSALAGAKILLR